MLELIASTAPKRKISSTRASVVQSTTATSTELDSGMGHSLMSETLVSNNQGIGLDHTVFDEKDMKAVTGGIIIKNNKNEEHGISGVDEEKIKFTKVECMGRVTSKKKGRKCPRVPLACKSRKNKLGDEKLKIRGGWKVGDEVVAQWDDGVWRLGFVHEIIKDMAYVVCKEGIAKAAKVLTTQLRHATIPVEALNMLEEELVTGDDYETSCDEAFSDSNGSVCDSYVPLFP